MASTAIFFKKYSILTHRWLGVVFSVLFLFWFLSGVIMMYWDYPTVRATDRLEHAEPLQPAQIKVSPAQALAAAGLEKPPSRVRITMLDGHPVYRFHSGRLQTLVSAETGEKLKGISQDAALRIASAWTRLPSFQAQFVGAMTEEDQWTLNKNVRPLRPFLKYAWPSGEEIYISQVTGEVQQYTTTEARVMGYLGAVIHWMYFTPLRKDTALWRVVIITLSSIGSLMTLLGIVVGVWLYSPSRRYRFPGGASTIPYSGWKRWHTIIGLVFGLVTFTWILSGMFSMNPGGWSPEFGPDGALQSKLSGKGKGLEDYGDQAPSVVIQQGSTLGEIELIRFAGEPFYLATTSRGDRTRYHAKEGLRAALNEEQLLAPLKAAQLPIVETRWVKEYEAYYIDRHHQKPLPALYVRLADGEDSIHYLDPVGGRVVESFDRRTRWNRWLYHGLHSMDLPWLYANRPAWDVTVLVLMLGGIALCVTSVWIAAVRLKRKLA